MCVYCLRVESAVAANNNLSYTKVRGKNGLVIIVSPLLSVTVRGTKIISIGEKSSIVEE